MNATDSSRRTPVPGRSSTAARSRTDRPGALPSLLDRPASEWRDLLAGAVDRPFRGDQVAGWVFDRGVFDFAAMTDLPTGIRERLARSWSVRPPEVDEVFTSVDGTRRYLVSLADGARVEAVWMPYESRVTLCISSQVGCRFGCTFCQTGRMGLTRSLTPGEIVGQVLRLRTEREHLERPVNVVFMGQGEPLDNAVAVCQAARALQDPRGPDLSWRRITVSTVGVVPELRRLAALGDQRPRIAVSLNATTDEVRAEIMPIDRKWPIATLIEALGQIDWRPRERVTFEYVLLAGINDSVDDADRLGELLSELPAKVNLIPWNPVADMPYRRPAPEKVEEFRSRARRSGLDVLVRYSRGADIAAACGQLHAASSDGVRAQTVG